MSPVCNPDHLRSFTFDATGHTATIWFQAFPPSLPNGTTTSETLPESVISLVTALETKIACPSVSWAVEAKGAPGKSVQAFKESLQESTEYDPFSESKILMLSPVLKPREKTSFTEKILLPSNCPKGQPTWYHLPASMVRVVSPTTSLSTAAFRGAFKRRGGERKSPRGAGAFWGGEGTGFIRRPRSSHGPCRLCGASRRSRPGGIWGRVRSGRIPW